MNYTQTVLIDALKDIQQTKQEILIRTELSCMDEIHKINVIEKQLERSIKNANTSYSRLFNIHLTHQDYRDIINLRKEYTVKDILSIYAIGDSYYYNFIKKYSEYVN